MDFKEWNSSLKCFLTVALLCFCISYNSILVSIFLFLEMNFFILKTLDYDFRALGKKILLPLSFVLMSVLPILIEISATYNPGKMGIEILGWYLFTDYQLIYKGLQLFFKVMAAYSILQFLLVTTPVYQIGGVLYRMKLPVPLVNLFYLTYRFIFMMQKTYEQLYQSAISRSGFETFGRSCRSFGILASALFIKSFNKTRVYMQAMDARGYEGNLMIYFEEEQVDSKAYLKVAFIGLSVVLVIALDMWLKR